MKFLKNTQVIGVKSYEYNKDKVINFKFPVVHRCVTGLMGHTLICHIHVYPIALCLLSYNSYAMSGTYA